MLATSLRDNATQAKTTGNEVDLQAVRSYLVFLLGVTALCNATVSDLSSFLTESIFLQGLGLVLLGKKIQKQCGSGMLSRKMLALYALSLAFRLSSTMWPNRCNDCLSFAVLAVFAFLMRSSPSNNESSADQSTPHIPQTIQDTPEPSANNMRDWVSRWVLLVCTALALHPHFGHFLVLDLLWTSSCYLEMLAMLPQLS